MQSPVGVAGLCDAECESARVFGEEAEASHGLLEVCDQLGEGAVGRGLASDADAEEHSK